MRTLRLGLLGLLISVLALAFIATQIDWGQFATTVTTANYIFVLPSAAYLMLGLLTRARRWQVLLRHGLPVWRAFGIGNVAYLINGLVPLRLGEVVRAYLASRPQYHVAIFQAASTIVVERLVDVVAVVVLLLLALTAGPLPPFIQQTGLVALMAALVGFGVLIAMARNRRSMHRLLAFVGRYIAPLRRPELQDWLDHALDGIQPITQPQTLISVLWWTTLSWFLSVAAGWVLMFAFFEEASWAASALFVAAASFAIAVPAVPGNVGTFEAAIIVSLAAMNYDDPERTLAFAIMVHAVAVLVYAITGIIGFIREGISLEQLSVGVQQMQQSSEVIYDDRGTTRPHRPDER